jgi:ectoine hydroxylase-related dioxygenase (phytanoyl-CoA dioxygenase family)
MNSPAGVDGVPIAAKQQRQFEELGYCVVDGLFELNEITAIELFFEGFKTDGSAVFDGHMKFEEIDPTQRQLRAMNPHRCSRRVKEWGLNRRVLGVTAILLGRSPLLAQTMYYFKPPGARGQGMHQDNFYLLAAPATCIAAWTAIDDATVENGCMQVVPGSHRRDILCPAEGAVWMNYGDSHIKPFPRDARPVPIEVSRGSTMFFGGNLIHGSGPNRTSSLSRRAFVSHYISEVSEQVARSYHPVLNSEGEIVHELRVPDGGGPCGDGWLGETHY